ncbi:uncharacterized protein LOC120633996 [Pararge aegeria]|uniref:uncharacterized protein LOC120633996 n=1 Tax=Pararge aegeria TaxID=116150 RepID=UPI0019D13DB6|nr:uncharacterized protein LOC120633996 [Pararge aegeria]
MSLIEKADLSGEILLTIIDFERHFEVLSFCVFIKITKDRLEIVNNLLEQVVLTKNRKNTLNIRDIKSFKNQNDNLYGKFQIINESIIRSLATSNDLIGEVCDEINKVYKFQILKALFTTFVYIIITIWSSIYYIRTSDVSNTLPRIVLISLFDIMSVCVMSYTCEVILLKRKSTKILVNELIMDYDLTRQMRIQAKAFMELIEVWPLQISAYDMFTIDIKLILKFISVSTTYLIVIIQVSHFL